MQATLKYFDGEKKWAKAMLENGQDVFIPAHVCAGAGIKSFSRLLLDVEVEKNGDDRLKVGKINGFKPLKEFLSPGKIKFFDKKKGFGFIAQPSGPDVYIHATDLTKNQIEVEIKAGMEILYSIKDSSRGVKVEFLYLEGSDETSALE